MSFIPRYFVGPSMIINTLEAFFRRGKHVCPFARARPHFYADVLYDTADLYQPVSAFAERGVPGQALVVPAVQEPTTFAELLAWAKHRFLHLAVVCGGLTFPEAARRDLETAVQRTVGPTFAPDSPVRPYLNVCGRPIITICLSPLYPAAHPRYAPVTCLVLTWADDIERIGELPAVRAVMRTEHGTVYDANEIVLPWPPATPDAS